MNKLFVLSVAAVLMAGCATETRGTRVTIDTDSGAATVLENSYRLSNRVKVIQCNYGDCGDGIRKATVVIESQTKRRQRLHLRMVWLDAEGVEIDADGKAYRTVVLDGADTYSFTGVSPNVRGAKAKVQIREVETVE